MILQMGKQLIRRVQEARKKRLCLAAEGVTLFPSCRIQNSQRRPEAIQIGAHSKIFGSLLVLAHGGQIQIGEHSFLSENSRIWSAVGVTVGNRVLISHNVEIHDTDSHSLSAAERHRHFVEIVTNGHPRVLDNVAQVPVVVEDDAWIGFNATILKGVTIGRGAIVAACSVVVHDVAPYTIVAGFPAKVIGQSYP